MRRLLCTDRVVPLDQLDDYLALWTRVSAAATTAGMRAWLFRAAGHDDQFREFVESDGGAPGDEDGADDVDAADGERSDIASALRDLEETFAARGSTEWEEVRP